jgi:hypothetical protein
LLCATGLSLALGAFLAGLLIAETEYALQVESDIAPYKGLLMGLFFMTVGELVDSAAVVRLERDFGSVHDAHALTGGVEQAQLMACDVLVPSPCMLFKDSMLWSWRSTACELLCLPYMGVVLR